VFGDAICSFKTRSYGQGMTVCRAGGGDNCATCLRAGSGKSPPRAFFKAAAKIVDNPWDYRGRQRSASSARRGSSARWLVRFINWYVRPKLHSGRAQ